MKIHEFQGKQLFAKFGVTVLENRVVSSAGEAASAFDELGGPVAVVKAQIHGGGTVQHDAQAAFWLARLVDVSTGQSTEQECSASVEAKRDNLSATLRVDPMASLFQVFTADLLLRRVHKYKVLTRFVFLYHTVTSSQQFHVPTNGIAVLQKCILGFCINISRVFNIKGVLTEIRSRVF